jgi:hypothetical protein
MTNKEQMEPPARENPVEVQTSEKLLSSRLIHFCLLLQRTKEFSG